VGFAQTAVRQDMVCSHHDAGPAVALASAEP
jgi:hypothetical protein